VSIDDEDLLLENETNVFQLDEKYEESEKLWEDYKIEILGEEQINKID